MNLHLAASCLAAVGLVVIQRGAFAGILAGTIGNPINGHIYYLLTENSWTVSKLQAVSLGGQLVTINDEPEQHWVGGKS